MAEYTNGDNKPQKVSSGTSTSSSSGSSKVRGVPQSFGYVKRHSAGTSSSPNGVQNGSKDATRTAQVSAVPRTKVCNYFYNNQSTCQRIKNIFFQRGSNSFFLVDKALKMFGVNIFLNFLGKGVRWNADMYN